LNEQTGEIVEIAGSSDQFFVTDGKFNRFLIISNMTAKIILTFFASISCLTRRL
jgi:hypothetical protein